MPEIQTEKNVKIESAPKPTGQLTAAERKQRYDELRKRLGKSKLEVKGDPNTHYFWAHKTDDPELIRLDTVGYFIVKEPNAADCLAGKATPKVQAAGLKADGTYQVGDVMLMGCPMETYEFLMLENDERSREACQAAKDNFKIEAQQVGAPVFEFDRPQRGR